MSDGNNFNSAPGVLGGVAAVITAIASIVGVWLNNQAPPDPPARVSTVQAEAQDQVIDNSQIKGDSHETTNTIEGGVSSTQNITQNNVVLISPAVPENDRASFEPSTSPPSEGTVRAVLVAQDSNTQINVRRGPGTEYDVRHYGLRGDYVNLLKVSADSSGQTWSEVEFPASGATGWIIDDFLEVRQY